MSTNEERELDQAVQRIAEVVSIYRPTAVRAEIERATRDMLEQLAPPSLTSPSTSYDAAGSAWDSNLYWGR
jgi:hypothetical protein